MRINIVNGLLQPVPPGALVRLMDKAGVPGLWKGENSSVYAALLPFALYLSKKMELPPEIGQDCVQKTCVEICEIATRDKRKRPSADKRRSNEKPVFTDWVEYAGWVLGRLKLNLKNAQREYCGERPKLISDERVLENLPEDPYALPAKKTAAFNSEGYELSRAD